MSGDNIGQDSKLMLEDDEMENVKNPYVVFRWKFLLLPIQDDEFEIWKHIPTLHGLEKQDWE